jgi:hypothetical protein
VGAVIAARQAGKLSQPHGNRLIRELRARRAEARSRAAEEYKGGDITLEQLKARQKAIEDEFEGSLPQRSDGPMRRHGRTMTRMATLSRAAVATAAALPGPSLPSCQGFRARTFSFAVSQVRAPRAASRERATD